MSAELFDRWSKRETFTTAFGKKDPLEFITLLKSVSATATGVGILGNYNFYKTAQSSAHIIVAIMTLVATILNVFATKEILIYECERKFSVGSSKIAFSSMIPSVFLLAMLPFFQEKGNFNLSMIFFSFQLCTLLESLLSICYFNCQKSHRTQSLVPSVEESSEATISESV